MEETILKTPPEVLEPGQRAETPSCLEDDVKQLLLKHLRDGSEKFNELVDFVEGSNSKDSVKDKILEKIPQIFLHGGMGVRLIEDSDYESIIDQLMHLTKEIIPEIDNC